MAPLEQQRSCGCRDRDCEHEEQSDAALESVGCGPRDAARLPAAVELVPDAVASRGSVARSDGGRAQIRRCGDPFKQFGTLAGAASQTRLDRGRELHNSLNSRAWEVRAGARRYRLAIRIHG